MKYNPSIIEIEMEDFDGHRNPKDDDTKDFKKEHDALIEVLEMPDSNIELSLAPQEICSLNNVELNIDHSLTNEIHNIKSIGQTDDIVDKIDLTCNNYKDLIIKTPTEDIPGTSIEINDDAIEFEKEQYALIDLLESEQPFQNLVNEIRRMPNATIELILAPQEIYSVQRSGHYEPDGHDIIPNNATKIETDNVKPNLYKAPEDNSDNDNEVLIIKEIIRKANCQNYREAVNQLLEEIIELQNGQIKLPHSLKINIDQVKRHLKLTRSPQLMLANMSVVRLKTLYIESKELIENVSKLLEDINVFKRNNKTLTNSFLQTFEHVQLMQNQPL